MPISTTIRNKLQAAFAPLLLDVLDESHRHAGHSGATRPDGSQGETHFQIKIVSAAFSGMSRVERQRRVYAVLAEQLNGPVHALSLTALTPAEAEARVSSEE